MTTEIPGMQQVLDFVERQQKNGILSTGAKRVDFSGDLYNVDGSTSDPKKIPGHDGVAWKQLLIEYGINANCYVTNANPEGSHPDFSVGGHMTTDPSGDVITGGRCYLMPLCFWHNGKKNDGVRFTHSNTAMLELSGYNLGELAATFQLRLPSKMPYAILYLSDSGWKHQDLSEDEAKNIKADFIPRIGGGKEANYVLFERVHGADTLHYIRDVNLPGAND